MDEKAKEVRRLYMRQYSKKYREENLEKILKRQREWRANNRDKCREYEARYWMKKAHEMAASKEVER